MGSPDDDFGTGVGNTDLTAGVTLLSELSGEEVVELGLEDTVGDELSALANDLRGRHLASC